jgi:hypothetical protein
MAIEYKIIEDKNLILAKGLGTVKGNDVLIHLVELAADENYISPMKKLVDYRNIDNIMISSEEAIAIAKKKKELSARFKNERCAFISPGDLTYGTSRVHQALIQGIDLNTEVFRNVQEAIDWLEVEIDIDKI